ncbi:MAG: S24 family peptidase [Bacteroidales bacterium]
MSVKERLITFINHVGVGQNKFALQVGLSAGFIASMKDNITLNTVSKIALTYPELNATWLMTGEGEMLNPNMSIGNSCKEETGYNTLPLISVEAAAGFANENFAITQQDVQAHYIVPEFKEVDFMIRVKGNSMYPKYSSGDVVACRVLRDSKFIEWNRPHLIATTEHGLLVKRICPSEEQGCILAVSDNEKYAPFSIPRNEITGLAIIVGVIRLE